MDKQSIVLVVDPEQTTLKFISVNLAARGHMVVAVPTAARALATAGLNFVDVAFIDLDVPDGGLELCRTLRNVYDVTVAAMTARTLPRDPQRARDAGASVFLLKPLGCLICSKWWRGSQRVPLRSS